jgi:N-acetyl-gamma-glutamyl-phosphate reductase
VKVSSGGEITAVIVGATGYTGGELLSILAHHPRVRLRALFGSSRPDRDRPPQIAELFPQLRGRVQMPVEPLEPARVQDLRPDAIFLATPHEVSLQLVGSLLPGGSGWAPRIFDLSGAFRLRPAKLYERFYGFTHTRDDLLQRAIYGMAELNRSALAEADLVAVPGCYPTAAILPLAPLARAGAIEQQRRPIIDATSGVSGAGRTPSGKTHFCEVSLQPYNVLCHRHNPEIDLHAGVQTVFTPHLGAFDRGILSTIHVELAEGWNSRRIADALQDAYGHERFVRLLPPGQWPSIAGVKGTNFCDIGWAVDEDHRHLIIVSALDNLVKGAAGQAVQCMNIRFHVPEAAGLEGALS